MSIEEDRQRYLAAAHAMQSGVAARMNIDPKDTTPKHLRVGVNSAMVEHNALAKLLIDKGIISEAEYVAAQADAMEREKALYERELTEHYGTTVTLA